MKVLVFITMCCVHFVIFHSLNGKQYFLDVKTSDQFFLVAGTGTDDDVTFTLYGLKNSAHKQISSSDSNKLERGTTTKVEIHTTKDLGDITTCKVEKYGSDDWHLLHIDIVDETSKKKYICKFNDWIQTNNATAEFVGCESSKIGKQCRLNCRCRKTTNYFSCYNNGTCKHGVSCERDWLGNTCQRRKIKYYARCRGEQHYVQNYLEDENNTRVVQCRSDDNNPYVSIHLATAGIEHEIIIASSYIYSNNTTVYQICRSSALNLYHYGKDASMVCQNITHNKGWHNLWTTFKDKGKYVSVRAIGIDVLYISKLKFDVCSKGTYGPDCSCICDHCKNLNCNYSGHCLEGSVNGQTGALCSVCPKNCICNATTGACDTCVKGWFGDICNSQCNQNCPDQECDKNSGKCKHCFPGHCEPQCPSNCLSCDRELGTCKSCSGQFQGSNCSMCKDGYYGNNCDQASCSRGCVDSECNKSTAECLRGCYHGFKGPRCNVFISNQTKFDSQDENTLIVIIASSVAVVTLVVTIIVLVIVLHRRKQKARKKETKQISTAMKFSDLQQNADISDLQNQNEKGPASIMSKKKNRPSADLLEEIVEDTLEDPPQDIKNHTDYYSFHKGNSIQVGSLWEYTQEKKAKNLFDEEFDAIQNGMLEKYDEAIKSTNVSKNRYKGIYPYDYNRIVLEPETGVSNSDYINASYINGFNSEKVYIASTGPFTDDTVIDFWRMIWQTNVNKIVMLTNLTEEGKQKCKQYWPEVDQIITYGTIRVKCTEQQVLANYTIRGIELWKENQKPKTLLHFHFTIWPDKGVPRNVTSVVEFRNKVRNTITTQKGPILVHCSAGIGRTGTYLALDYLIEQGESTKSVNVIDCVTTFRHQRAKAVQTSEQYEFIHDALAEALNAGRSTVPTEQFYSYYRDLMTNDKITGKSKLQEQYELLVKLTPTFDDKEFSTAKLKENRLRHRYNNISAADRYRIYLQPLTSRNLENNYINAIFLPAYKERNAFLLTEMPLPNTIEAFWQMIFQENCSLIIMLNDIKKDKTFGTYWPVKSKEVEFGPVRVTLLEKEGGNGPFDILKLKALFNTGTRTEEKIVKQFQCKFWPENAICPPNPHPMLELMESVTAWQRQTGNPPTVVHCMDGAKQSGLYCALFAIIERLRTDHDVSVFQTILQLRTRRGQIVPDKDQLEFCYETVLAYLESFNMYSNFK